MTAFTVSVISGVSILLPTLVGVFRYQILTTKYLPLLILLVFGTLSDGFSYWIIKDCGSNTVNGNFDVLIDFVLTVWLYRNLNSGLSKKFLITVVICGSLVWIADNLVVHSLYSNNSLFRMVASFLIVFLSTDKINQVIFSSGFTEPNRPDQVLSAGFLVYFTYKAFVEAYHVFPVYQDKSFYINLWVILGIINMIVNLMFTVAILCISKKTRISIRL